MKKFIIILLCIVTIEIYYFYKKNNAAKYVNDSVFSLVNISFESVYEGNSGNLLANSYVMDTPDNLSDNLSLNGLGFVGIGIFLILICKNKSF